MNHSRMIIKWIKRIFEKKSKTSNLLIHTKLENFVANSMSSLMTEVKYSQNFYYYFKILYPIII